MSGLFGWLIYLGLFGIMYIIVDKAFNGIERLRSTDSWGSWDSGSAGSYPSKNYARTNQTNNINSPRGSYDAMGNLYGQHKPIFPPPVFQPPAFTPPPPVIKPHVYTPPPPVFNPANGLPMPGGRRSGYDTMGNLYGQHKR